MRSLFRSFYLQIKEALNRAMRWVSEHRRPLALLAVFSVFLLAPHTADAFSLTGAATDALKLIVGILAWVVEMLGKLFVYLVDIFLGFARYNKFGEAQPVKIGWVIVRDICNMFFIVVLLISAFSTIIGWDSSLRYNQVLPKLLLMAILINFSRTLIQVLIDFSQVVMLTFVNAFQAAGAGNFTAAFRINDLLSMRDNFSAESTAAVEAAGDSNYDLVAQVFTSFLLALILIVIANGVMLIMIIYILARIIGLWMALIFSPLAFFVKALPSSLQSGLSSFSSKYWSRLSGMLTGGPVVMFFIYLTFAILQTAPNNPPANPSGQTASGPTLLGAQGGGLSNQLELYTPTSEISTATSFLTKVGTSDNVASFIVAVALMLMALEAAIEAANSVSESVGKVASTIGSASKGLAYGAAALAASSPWLATKFGYRTLDKRYDMTGKASSAGLWLANKVPVAGQYARPLLMKGMMMRKNERRAEAKENMAAMEGMTPDQVRLVQAGFRSVPGAAIGGLANAVTGKISGGLQSLSFKAQERGGILGRVGGAALSGLSRGVDKANKGLGQAWFTGGDQLTNLEIAKRLSSDETIAEDQTRLEDELEDEVNRDARWKHLSQKERDDIAENRAASMNRQQVSQQLATREELAKRSLIDSPAERAAVKAQAKANPMLWAKEEKRRNKAKQLFEQPAKIKDLSSDAKKDVGLVIRGLMGRGIASLDEQTGVISITGDKAARDKLLEELGKVDTDYADTVDKVIKHITNDEVAMPDGGVEEGSSFQDLTESRIEIDSGDTKRVVNDTAAGKTLLGKGADALASATGGAIKLPLGGMAPVSLFGQGSKAQWAAGTAQPDTPTGRFRRNAVETKAIKELTDLATNNNMDSDAAGQAFGRLLAADGQIGDIENIPGFEKAAARFVASIRAQIQPLLEYDADDGLQVSGRVFNQATGQWDESEEVRNQNEVQLQALTKQMRPILQQIGDRMNQKTIEGMLQAMSPSMTVHGATAADAPLPITEVWTSSKTAAALGDRKTKEAVISLVTAAQTVTSAPVTPEGGQAAGSILSHARKNYGSSNSNNRRKVSPGAQRGLAIGTES